MSGGNLSPPNCPTMSRAFLATLRMSPSARPRSAIIGLTVNVPVMARSRPVRQGQGVAYQLVGRALIMANALLDRSGKSLPARTLNSSTVRVTTPDRPSGLYSAEPGQRYQYR